MDNESNEPNQTPKHSICPAIKAKLLPAMLHVHGVHDGSAAFYEYYLGFAAGDDYLFGSTGPHAHKHAPPKMAQHAARA